MFETALDDPVAPRLVSGALARGAATAALAWVLMMLGLGAEGSVVLAMLAAIGVLVLAPALVLQESVSSGFGTLLFTISAVAIWTALWWLALSVVARARRGEVGWVQRVILGVSAATMAAVWVGLALKYVKDLFP